MATGYARKDGRACNEIRKQIMKRYYLVVIPVLLLSSIGVYASTKRKRNFKDYDASKLPDPKGDKIPNLSKLIDQL